MRMGKMEKKTLFCLYRSNEINEMADKINRIYLLNFSGCHLSRYQDSNLGPPAPKAGALTGLRYTSILRLQR